MAKYKYVTEFELRAGVKMLFPYLSNPGEMQEWLADQVNISNDKVYEFVWEDDQRKAKIATKRTNSHIKYIFIQDGEEDDDDPSYLEFKINFNEMTQSSFLKVIDYSDMDDEEELEDLWVHLVGKLKETVGG
ncbi:START-like domain-containing protein [Flammeovirgaceae bacterium SG7u.111]|nr:START-like domain-containing protein [Flammeovirgaceae bacterium SG7u.132]WPO37070.1 START-like domain-containing protein [Flammeovirgaceae bacterium SG7u.111]